MGKLIRILTLSILASMAIAAQAGEDHIASRALLEDKESSLSIEQASHASFKPARPILAAGYTNSTHWLRLIVRPRADGGELVLRIRPTYLDEITLFEPDATTPGRWRTRVTGDRTPWTERDYPSILPGFAVHPAAETTYYLRLKTTSTSLLNVEALTPLDAARADIRQGFGQGVYLAFMVWILFWAIQDFLLFRQAVVGWFILAQATYLAFSVAIMGYIAPLLPAARYLDALTSYLVWGMTFTSILFHRQLLGMFRPPQLLLRVMESQILAIAAAMPLLLAGHARLALQLNATTALLAAPVLLALAFSARHEALPGRRMLRLFYALLTLSTAAAIAPLLNLSQAAELHLQGTLIHGLIAATLMGTFLYLRSRQLQIQGAKASLNLEMAEHQLHLEHNRLKERESFMAMLTHELKTPLSIVRMSLDAMQARGPRRQRMDRALRDMDAIVGRFRQADQMEQSELSLHAQSCDINRLIADTAAASAAPTRLRIADALPPHLSLQTDPQLAATALANLLDNALKYSPPQTSIDVCLESAEADGRAGIRITIANIPGTAGLPDPDKVFAKYYRSPGAHSQSGSGLGLYLVRGIAERLSGHATYRGTENEVSFSLWLPR